MPRPWRIPFSAIAATELAGRLLLSAIFLLSGSAKIVDWSGSLRHVVSSGLPIPELLLASAAAIELLAGLALLLGFRTRAAAIALFAYLIPVTLIFHGFWALEGMERQAQTVNFMKNLAILGGLLKVFVEGAGRISLDWRRFSHGGRLADDFGNPVRLRRVS